MVTTKGIISSGKTIVMYFDLEIDLNMLLYIFVHYIILIYFVSFIAFFLSLTFTFSVRHQLVALS